MPIVFDATLGSSSANSYVTVARADELLPILVSSTRLAVWSALDTTAKETYLMRAVRLMEAYIDWEGTKIDDWQPIGWPRQWIYGPDRSTTLPTDEVPQAVEESQALMALNLAEGFDQNEASASPVDYLKVSSISISFASQRASRSSMLLPSEVVEKLRGFGSYVGASGMGRSVTMFRG